MSPVDNPNLVVWIVIAACITAAMAVIAGKDFRFSLLAMLFATCTAGAVLMLMAFVLADEPQRLTAGILAQLGIGTVLYQTTGLLAAAYTLPRLVLRGRGAAVLAWLSGMTFSWAVCLITLLLLA